MAEDPLATMRSEARALAELAALHRDPVFYGRGVPRGDGRTVLVIPGLFGNDLYLRPLRSWLSRIGYRPVRSGVSINAGCPDRLRTEIERSLSPQLAQRPDRHRRPQPRRDARLGDRLAAAGTGVAPRPARDRRRRPSWR